MYHFSHGYGCTQSFLGPSLANVCPGSQFVIFMAFVDLLIRSKKEVSQLCQRVRPINPLHNDEYDFIVVGGGSAGAVVASRLSENPNWKVLLLEAGPDEPPGADVPSMVAMFLGTEIDWQYRTVNESNACLSTGGSCSWPRGKNLGGTSVHNGMMYIRGHAKDYDNWAKNNPGWSWSEVLPYFIRSENNADIGQVDHEYHGVGGLLDVARFPWRPPITQNILDAAYQRGYGTTKDLNGNVIVGFTVAQTNNDRGVRASSASAFLRPFRNRPNLHVALNATATKIQIANLKAVGVEYIQNGQLKLARSSREIVVSGGAVDSPKLLLLSGIGPRQHLDAVGIPVRKDLPGVGENLHNHISYSLSYTINEPNIYDLNWRSIADYLHFLRGPMSSTGLSQLTGILPSSHTTRDHPDLQFYFGGYQASCAISGETDTIQDGGVNGNLRSISITPTNLRPLSKGNLRLASSNPMDKPIIWGNYLSVPQDVDVLVEGIMIALKLMDAPSMQAIRATFTDQPIPACSAHRFMSFNYWRCAVKQNTGPENHQAGSCKMGPSNDPMAVVDSRLKVHGIAGLRVADTSIMPQVTSGNTAAPAMMIGERAAEFIKEDYGFDNLHWFRKICKHPHSIFDRFRYWVSRDNSLEGSPVVTNIGIPRNLCLLEVVSKSMLGRTCNYVVHVFGGSFCPQ